MLIIRILNMCWDILWVFLFVYCGHNCVSSADLPSKFRKAGPYNVLPKELFNCMNEEEEEDFHVAVQIYRNSEGKTLTAVNATCQRDYDFNETGQVKAFIKGNGGWKFISTWRFKSVCQYMFSHVWETEEKRKKMAKYFHMGKPFNCPFQKGLYETRTLPFGEFANMIQDNIPHAVFGEYKYKFESYQGERMTICVGGIFEVVPKPA